MCYILSNPNQKRNNNEQFSATKDRATRPVDLCRYAPNHTNLHRRARRCHQHPFPSYISAGPELILTAQTDSGVEAAIGDTLPAEATTVTVRWQNGHAGDSIRFVVDGKCYRAKIVGAAGEMSWRLAAGQARWCSAELRDAEEGMWALTNLFFWA